MIDRMATHYEEIVPRMARGLMDEGAPLDPNRIHGFAPDFGDYLDQAARTYVEPGFHWKVNRPNQGEPTFTVTGYTDPNEGRYGEGP